MLEVLRRIRGLAVLMVMVMALVITALPQQANAAAGNPSYCDADVPRLTNKNIGKEVPVVLVHGLSLNGTAPVPGVWGSLDNAYSFAAKINNIPGVAVAHSFGYNTWNWVTDPGSGPKLAKTIDCVSQLSTHNGGKGKVIVVAYSMGGLVTREALSHLSTDGHRYLHDEVGQVITIATPHQGIVNGTNPTSIFTWFNAGSPELNALPQFPPETIVHTIAGDVTNVTTDFITGQTTRDHLNSDTVVPVSSALSGYTSDVSKGGGTKTVTCNKYYGKIFSYTYNNGDAICEHGQMISQASNGVQPDTIATIKKYVDWLNTPPVIPSGFTAGTITVTFDDRWTNAGYGASGPNEDIIGDDGSGALLIINMANWCTDGRTMMECMTQGDWTNNQVGTAPAITVGGRTPDSSVRFIQGSGTNGNRLFWCFEAEKVCIDYGTGADVNLQPSAALLDLLHSATWSN
jgi:pimeloyl-ACP methyl ester carboxylesterase